MKEINYKSVGERIFEETLPNGLKVIYYPTEKSKNFYITVSTNYGANVTSYIKNGKKIEVIPGTAHFLEHRIMDFTKNKKASDLINGLGSSPNAYTMYDITNYNLIGSVDIIKNITLLLDRVFKPNITEKDVKNEVGIISEEIDMENDNVNYIVMSKIFKNAFINDKSITTPILGTKETISKITSKYLIDIYNDFYTYDRMHIVITGDFDLEKVSEHINKYFTSTKPNKKNIKIPLVKEPKNVKEINEEVYHEVSERKTSVLYKIPILNIKGISKTKYERYLGIIIECLFGSTSPIREKLKQKGISKFAYFNLKAGKYNMLEFLASGNNGDEFLKLVRNVLTNPVITKKEFTSKIKVEISSLILNFEDIVEVENMITNQIKTYGKIVKNARREIESLNYNELKKVLKTLNFENYTTLKVKPNEE